MRKIENSFKKIGQGNYTGKDVVIVVLTTYVYFILLCLIFNTLFNV